MQSPNVNVVIRVLCALAGVYFAMRSYDSIRSTRSGRSFKIVDVAGRGKGAVATRDIEGELIIKEEPIFLVHAGSFEDPLKHIRSVLSTLNSTQRETYLALSHPLTAGDPNMPLAIFQTNSIKIKERPDAAGVFALTSRFNHGCSKAFNSVPSWREEGFLVVHALKQIKKGQEILIPYIDTRQPRDARQAYLAETYGFNCSCSVCSLSPHDSRRSDARLSSMATIQAEFATWEKANIDGQAAVRLAKRIWALGDKEAYWSGRGRLARDVVKIAAAHEDERAAREWAQLAEEWYTYEFGYDSEEAERMRVISSDPSKHAAWATRDGLRVGGPDMAL